MKSKLFIFAVLTIVLALGGIANAATTIDVVQFPTGYFVGDDSQTGNAPYYRWYNEDWEWTHKAIGGSISTATLNISGWDIDAASGEVDEIYAYDNGVKTLIGTLTGVDGSWSYSTFTLGSNFFDDINSGLKVFMDIDTTHTEKWWAVALSKSVLSIDGGELPPPAPSVPLPPALILLGSGLTGLVALRNKFKK